MTAQRDRRLGRPHLVWRPQRQPQRRRRLQAQPQSLKHLLHKAIPVVEVMAPMDTAAADMVAAMNTDVTTGVDTAVMTTGVMTGADMDVMTEVVTNPVLLQRASRLATPRLL